MIQTPNSAKQALFCARGELAVKSLGEFPPTRLGRVGGLPLVAVIQIKIVLRLFLYLDNSSNFNI